jgi:hypothetical protein
MPTFDPITDRKYWLDSKLERETNFEPAKLTRMGRGLAIALNVNDLIEAYYVGLADAVRPTLEKIIVWMESQQENEPRQYSKEFGHWRAGWADLYAWRRDLGLCKWLSRGDRAQHDFARALNAEWYSWTEVSPNDAALDRVELLDQLTENLAMAIAARNPALGLKFLARVDRKEWWDGCDVRERPVLPFGEWACRHLAAGGRQDAEFVDQGVAMLRAALPGRFLEKRNEAALWLKAIFWDTGIARTPEQAIARIYDFLPGIERPDFVPS